MTPTCGFRDAIADEIAADGLAGFVLGLVAETLLFGLLAALLLASVIVLWAAQS